MSQLVKAKVTRRNFNRARCGTKLTLEALLLSGWQPAQDPSGVPVLTRDGVSVNAPPQGHTGIEWINGERTFSLVPLDAVVILPGASGKE